MHLVLSGSLHDKYLSTCIKRKQQHTFTRPESRIVRLIFKCKSSTLKKWLCIQTRKWHTIYTSKHESMHNSIEWSATTMINDNSGVRWQVPLKGIHITLVAKCLKLFSIILIFRRFTIQSHAPSRKAVCNTWRIYQLLAEYFWLFSYLGYTYHRIIALISAFVRSSGCATTWECSSRIATVVVNASACSSN